MGKIKNIIYDFLEKKRDVIERVCDVFCTESQKKCVIDSLYDRRNFLPNAITLSRIPGILPVYCSVFSGNPAIIAGTILLVSSTDALDGWCARHITKNANPGGALLDCATDKVYSLALVIPAICTTPMLVINGILEGVIGYINKKATERGSEQRSTWLGKIKMWPLSITTGLIYVNIPLNSSILCSAILIGISVTAVLEVVNIIQYKEMAKKNIEDMKKSDYNPISVNNYGAKKMKSRGKEKRYETVNVNDVSMDRSVQIQELKCIRNSLVCDEQLYKGKVKSLKRR